MPKFYFHVVTPTARLEDIRGEDLSDREEIEDHAREVLMAHAQGGPLEGDDHEFSVDVRDADGEPVHDARLTIRGRWGPAD